MTNTKLLLQLNATSHSQTTPDITESSDSAGLIAPIIIGTATVIGMWSVTYLLMSLLNMCGFAELGARWLAGIIGSSSWLVTIIGN